MSRRRGLVVALFAAGLLLNAVSSADARPPDWKALIYEAYAGPIHHTHSCASVRQALAHLPSFLPALAVLKVDLRAYERRVC